MWYLDDIETNASVGLGIAWEFDFAGDKIFIVTGLDGCDKLIIYFFQRTRNNRSLKNIRVSLLDQRPVTEPEHITCHTTLDPENGGFTSIETNMPIDDIRKQRRYFSPKYTDNRVLKLTGNISLE